MTGIAASKETVKKGILTVLWLSIFCLYWTEIIRINFSQNPLLYCADMYSDMMYAAAAWRERSIFPEGWVFGNQYYAVATPVLAALMFAFTNDPCIAMGLASTVMGLGVVFSFNWMLKPVFQELHLRLAAVVLFMTAVLWCGDAVYTVNGWQLFFTMCAYYACYAITAFLSIGCFLRRHDRWTPGFWIMLLLACGFSFGTGVQSLRQTAISVIPVLAAAGWEQLHAIRYQTAVSRKSLILTGALVLSNLAGILYSGTVSPPKHEIFGALSLAPMPDLMTSVGNALRLFGDGWILGLAAMIFACFCLVSQKRTQLADGLWTCLFLCLVSTGVILVIDTFTAMQVRPIYYFLLFPMSVIVFVYGFPQSRTANSILAVGILLLTLTGGRHRLDTLPSWQDDHPLASLTDCLEEKGISVVFTQWNLGGKIAIASDFRVRVGFWDAADDVFEPVEYLCDPAIFDSDPGACAYLVSGARNLSLAQERARVKEAELRVLKYFPALDLYLFVSDQPLMDS